MKAADARQLAQLQQCSVDVDRNKRIESSLASILSKIEKQARKGQTSMLFSPENLDYTNEDDEVKRRLQHLGYYFIKENDNGLSYTMINW